MTADARDFSGRWESANDDGTMTSVLEIQVSGTTVSGAGADVERGFFSGRQSVKSRLEIRGTMRNGSLEVSFRDPDGGGSAAATLFRRGRFLIVRIGGTERGFARPGESLVDTAEGSPEAAALARAIAGRVFSSSAQASGRGAFVGRRMRIALCSDGRIEYDASDLASTPGSLPGGGVDAGGGMSRRGTWSVVLLAGAPAIQARWRGTGTSYSLTRYFDVRVAADGTSAVVDGTTLPLTGRC